MIITVVICVTEKSIFVDNIEIYIVQVYIGGLSNIGISGVGVLEVPLATMAVGRLLRATRLLRLCDFTDSVNQHASQTAWHALCQSPTVGEGRGGVGQSDDDKQRMLTAK